MNKLRIAIILLLGLTWHICYGQQDSVATDTIIVIKDPVIVRKQVFANPASQDKPKDVNKWNIEAFFLGAKPILTSSHNPTQLSPNYLYTGGILITRNLKSFELGIGVSLATGSFQYKSTNTSTNTTQYDSTYTHLLDSYIQTVAGKDTTVYITEQRDTLLNKTTYSTTIQSGNPTFTYLQIPISLGYKFNIWNERLYIIPRVQLIYSILSSHSADGYASPKNTIWSYAAQLNVMYTFGNRISVMAKTQWHSNFTSPYASQSFQSLTYGIGLEVHF